MLVSESQTLLMLEYVHYLWQVVESPHGNDLFCYLRGGMPLSIAHKVLSHGLKDGLRAAPHQQTVLHDNADQLRITLSQPP